MSHQLPVALDDEAIEQFGRELDAIQREVKASLGEADRAYIRRMITIQRSLAIGGRVLIFASSPLERYARDAEVVTRHNQLQFVNYEAAGRTMLGLESNSPLF